MYKTAELPYHMQLQVSGKPDVLTYALKSTMGVPERLLFERSVNSNPERFDLIAKSTLAAALDLCYDTC